MAHVFWFVPLLLMFLLVPLIALLFVGAIVYVCYLVTAIPYFIMARTCEYHAPWIVFIPMCKDYIAFTLPFNEYRLGFIKIKHRSIVFWSLLIFKLLGFVSFFIRYIYVFLIKPFSIPAPETEGVFQSDIYSIVFAVISFLIFALLSLIHWRKNYDLLKAYGMDQHAIWAPLVNIICPLIMVIFSYIIMNKEPINGGWGYYREKI
ncbi:MAG: hypothetical protein IJA29_00140 [Lachnospiraceae bacterium]|nr:hypothetical protein [Lachnospiraceae bacterium]